MGLDMSAMDVNVGSVSFEKDVARASVSFVPKGMPPGSGGMSMDYVLERKGDKWAVKGREVNPASTHGDQPLPAGHAIGPSSRGSPAMKTVAVLGGGPAGSFAAERLANAG